MKRTPLKRRSPLRAKKAITRRAPVRRGKAKKQTAHALRPRAPAVWFDWIHTQPCFVKFLTSFARFLSSVSAGAADELIDMLLRNLTECRGGIEADHMGSKMKDGGDGEMAADRTCVSICKGHHGERHDFSDTFKDFCQEDMRSFLALGIAWMHARANEQGIEIPDC